MRRKHHGRDIAAAAALAAALALGTANATAFADLASAATELGAGAQYAGTPVYAHEDAGAGADTGSDAGTDAGADAGSGEAQGLQALGNSFDFASDAPRAGLLAQADDYPSQFDLRSVDTDGDGIGDRCYVTPVKLQNPFGDCWGFAAVAAAETSILGSLMSDDADAYQTLDLSEKQLAYFSHTYLSRAVHPQDGEGVHQKGAKNAYDVYGGGSIFLATSVFAQGIGPVHESKDEVFAYKGANGQTVQHLIDGKYRNFSYSEEDDWALDESARFEQDFVLKESYILPSPAKTDENGAYVYNEAGTAAIKQQLMEKRAVAVGFHADTSQPSQESEGAFLNPVTWAHYTYEMGSDAQPNHAVTIVGWDDDYAAENFNEGEWTDPATGTTYNRVRPPANGAWLVKNSWGSGERDFPNRGGGAWGIRVAGTDADGNPATVGSGYFWLSYYDQSINSPESFIFDEDKTGKSYNLDEHDFMPAASIDTAASETETKMANVFTAESNERLTAVSFETSTPNTTVTYEVYLLADGYTSPTDGQLMAKGAPRTYEYGGFYKASLADAQTGGPFNILKGQSYAVIVTQTLDVGGATKYAVNLTFGLGDGSPLLNEGDSYSVGVINEGESLVYLDGAWQDFSYEEVREKAGVNPGMVTTMKAVYDNFPIKGFCEILPDDVELRVTNAESKLYVNGYAKRKTMRAVLYGGANQELGIANVAWTLADGGATYVSAAEADGGAVALTAKSMGSTSIAATVTSADGLTFTKVIPVVVGKVVPYRVVFLPKNATPYTGSEIEPSPLVSSNVATTLTENVDYTLEYVDNVKCGAAYVEVTSTDTADPAGAADDKIRGYFAITPQATTIEAAEAAGETSLAVTVGDQQATGVDGYQVDYREAGADEWRTKAFGAESATLVLDGLDYNAPYELRVRSFVNTSSDAQTYGLEAAYYGDYSDTASATTFAHEWGEPTYAWSADDSLVCAQRACAHCNGVQSETVQATSKQTKAAGPTTAGQKVCTAQFSSEWATAQEKAVALPPTGRISIAGATVTGVKAKTFTGKALTQSPKVKVGGTLLEANTDYLLIYKKNVKVGTATVKVKGINNYKGTRALTFKVKKAKQPMTLKAAKKTAKRATLKKRAVKLKGALRVKASKGKLTYKNVSKAKTPKRFKVNAKTGVITVPKGTKKGTWKLKVKVTAKGNANYKKGSKTATVRITVK